VRDPTPDAGVIQQLGAPQDLYETPANVFVAGFIGSPSMDFFNARLVRVNDTALLHVGSGADTRTLHLGESLAGQLVGQAVADGHQVILGIRPENFRLATPDDPDTLVGTVDVVEHLGHEQILYVSPPGAIAPEVTETQGSTVRIGLDAVVRPGDRIALAADIMRLHVFDATTQQRFV
jgi:multiple sugar transport system ATP-binding protein